MMRSPADANISNSTFGLEDDDIFSEIFEPKLSKTVFLILSFIFTTAAVLLSLAIISYERFGSDQVNAPQISMPVTMPGACNIKLCTAVKNSVTQKASVFVWGQ